jgi:hypothetical protein
MQNIIVDKPYRFIPACHSDFWPWLFQKFKLYEPHLRKNEGVYDYECRHVERLQASLAAGHGILLTPNHCRTADPVVMGWLAKAVGMYVYAMASWHLFNQGRVMAWVLRRMGAFSVNREGIDRQAINTAIDVLETTRRPLILFPEGGASRTNDRLHALLDISVIPRAAAKKRAKQVPGGKVVVHPIAIKYLFRGDLEHEADQVLTRIEQRLTWRPQDKLPLLIRIAKLGRALLSLKEIEYLGQIQPGRLGSRIENLINHLLCPIEQEWLGESRSGAVVPRVKALRIKLLPDMIEGRVDDAERKRRWEQLEDTYLAQQLSLYPPDYVQAYPSVDRLLETVERLEEDLTGRATVHGPQRAVIDVGEAIEVSPERDRSAEVDPLMTQIEDTLQGMLDQLALESALYKPSA